MPADGIASRDVGVVVDLDPPGRVRKVEDARNTFQQFALAARLRQPAGECLACVVGGKGDRFGLGTALGHVNADPVAGAHAQRLGHQLRLRQRGVDQDLLWRQLVGIELADEGIHDFSQCRPLLVAGEVGACAVILSPAKEEHLDAGLIGLAVAGDDVDVVKPGRLTP